MAWPDIEWHRDRYSRAAGEGPWITNPAEMGAKTCVRKLYKKLPSANSPMRLAVELDEKAEQGISQDLGAGILSLEGEAVKLKPELGVTTPVGNGKLDKLVAELKNGEKKPEPKEEGAHGEADPGRVDPADGRGTEGTGADARPHDAGTGGAEGGARGGKEGDALGRAGGGAPDSQAREVDPGRPTQGRSIAVPPALAGVSGQPLSGPPVGVGGTFKEILDVGSGPDKGRDGDTDRGGESRAESGPPSTTSGAEEPLRRYRAGAPAAFNRSALIDQVNGYFSALGIDTMSPKDKAQRSYLWQHFVGQGVKDEEAGEAGLRTLVAELEKLVAKKKAAKK
jgi:hypothetical protein